MFTQKFFLLSSLLFMFVAIAQLLWAGGFGSTYASFLNVLMITVFAQSFWAESFGVE